MIPSCSYVCLSVFLFDWFSVVNDKRLPSSHFLI